MGEYAWFAVVCAVGFVVILALGYWSSRVERRWHENRMREVLSEARDNRVREMQTGWVERGFDPEERDG